MTLPDPGKSKRAAFARAAQETFLSEWVHGGLLSAADAVLFVSRGADEITGGGRRRGHSDDPWRAVAAELASKVEGRLFPGRLVEKASEVGRLTSNKSRKASSEKPRPWDTWSSSSGEGADADTEAGADPIIAGASALLEGLLRAGRSEEALLAGCRLASSSGGASVAWKCIVECAAASWGAGAAAAAYIDAVAEIYSAFAGYGGGPRSRRPSAAPRRSAGVFESAFAGAVAALSGDLPVRKGWRSHAASAANALAPGSPFMVALNTVPRTLKVNVDASRGKGPEGGKAKLLTNVVTQTIKKSQSRSLSGAAQPPSIPQPAQGAAQGAAQTAARAPCVRVVMF